MRTLMFSFFMLLYAISLQAEEYYFDITDYTIEKDTAWSTCAIARWKKESQLRSITKPSHPTKTLTSHFRFRPLQTHDPSPSSMPTELRVLNSILSEASYLRWIANTKRSKAAMYFWKHTANICIADIWRLRSKKITLWRWCAWPYKRIANDIDAFIFQDTRSARVWLFYDSHPVTMKTPCLCDTLLACNIG